MIPVRDPMQKTAQYKPARAHGTIFDGFIVDTSKQQGQAQGHPRTAHKCANARWCASERSHRTPRTPTTTSGPQIAQTDANTPEQDAYGVPDTVLKRATQHRSERLECSEGRGGAARMTAGTTLGVMAGMTATKGGVLPAHHERKHV